ncbi:hypothetical protein TNCV_2453691 [Trichonephila clavipes]|nr:hypothetical protein TNCV_2453691 [Trichonephila clavipes]
MKKKGTLFFCRYKRHVGASMDGNVASPRCCRVTQELNLCKESQFLQSGVIQEDTILLPSIPHPEKMHRTHARG